MTSPSASSSPRDPDTDVAAGVGSPDLRVGAFSDQGPWVLDPDDLVWRRDVARIRARTRAEVRRVLTPGGFPPLARLWRVATVVVGALALWLVLEYRRVDSRAGIARRMRRAFERLGSSYVKLGQIVSSGDGMFPDELVGEFKLLRDQVPAESFDAVRAVVEHDLGGRLEDFFAAFEERPLAAASIAQVHAARLVTGEDVVVKVQRPRVGERFREDIATLAWLAPHLVGRIPGTALANPPALVELFAETVIEELDFRLEADNMLAIAAVLVETSQRSMIVPRPHPRLVTRRVLVMERLGGIAYDDVVSMQAAGIDTHALLQAALIMSLEGAMIHGVFHGDLHGGNLVVTPDGRTVLFDFGQTGRLGEPERRAFLRMIMTGTIGDTRGQLAALRDLGAFPPDVDLDAVIADLDLDGPVKDPTQMSADELVLEMRDMISKLLGYGARAPKELMLFVKNMMFLNSATAALAPDLDMLAQMTNVYAYFAETHGDRILRDAGIDTSTALPDPDAVKAAFLVDSDVESLTFRDLQARREEVRRKLAERRRRTTRRPPWRGR